MARDKRGIEYLGYTDNQKSFPYFRPWFSQLSCVGTDVARSGPLRVNVDESLPGFKDCSQSSLIGVILHQHRQRRHMTGDQPQSDTSDL